MVRAMETYRADLRSMTLCAEIHAITTELLVRTRICTEHGLLGRALVSPLALAPLSVAADLRNIADSVRQDEGSV